MSSKKEEEKNEKIIRGLMKLPPNRKCINCNSLGPQYVCTNFWTFVCIACSGIHREFTHRVKSVSMAKFTKQEVEALQRGGNQRAREMFLKDWDMQRMRLPNSSNPDKIREFIKNVYVDKKYAGGRSSDKPPRDMQGSKNHEEEHRRASSYHSYSQSPPYEQQYEERRYGKQSGVLTRKPGSDRALYEGKISSFMFSPGRLREHMYEDRFANESTGSRISDYSVSSAGDPFRHDGHSPNFQDTGYSSPPQKVRDILVQDTRVHMLNPRAEANIRENFDGIPRPHRTTSSSSFGSFDSNSMSLKSVNSGSLVVVLDPEHPSKTQQAEASTFGTLLLSSTSQSADHDLVNLPSMQPPRTTSALSIDLFTDVNYQPSSVTAFEQKPLDLFADINHQPASMTPSEQKTLDLFADINHQPSSMNPSEQKPLDLFADKNHQPSSMTLPDQKPVAIAQPENEGWATFDLPQNVRHASGMNEGTSSMLPSKDGGQKENKDVLSSIHNGSQWFPFPSSAAVGPFPPTADHWDTGVHKVHGSSDPNNSELWNAFDDFSAGNIPQSMFGSVPFSSELQGSALEPSTSGDNVVLKLPEGSVMDGFLNSAVDNGVMGFKGPSTGASGPQFPPPVPPVTDGTVQDRKSTNPFDAPFDSDVNATNAFLDVTSLQSALPNPQLPSPFLGGLPQPWFPQSSVNSYIPPVPQGGLSYVAGQTPNPQLPNVPPQGSVASLGGNPFA